MLKPDQSNHAAALKAAHDAVKISREAVERWMRSEADSLRLRCNADCPFWAGYVDAERKLSAILSQGEK